MEINIKIISTTFVIIMFMNLNIVNAQQGDSFIYKTIFTNNEVKLFFNYINTRGVKGTNSHSNYRVREEGWEMPYIVVKVPESNASLQRIKKIVDIGIKMYEKQPIKVYYDWFKVDNIWRKTILLADGSMVDFSYDAQKQQLWYIDLVQEQWYLKNKKN